MNYFPPPNTLTAWPTTSGRTRRTLYKGWWMAVTEEKKFRAKIWKFVHTGPYYFQQKCVEKGHSFKTEKEAVDWCEHTVEMETISSSLLFQEKGSGI